MHKEGGGLYCILHLSLNWYIQTHSSVLLTHSHIINTASLLWLWMLPPLVIMGIAVASSHFAELLYWWIADTMIMRTYIVNWVRLCPVVSGNPLFNWTASRSYRTLQTGWGKCQEPTPICMTWGLGLILFRVILVHMWYGTGRVLLLPQGTYMYNHTCRIVEHASDCRLTND